jgi:hypothetical protein
VVAAEATAGTGAASVKERGPDQNGYSIPYNCLRCGGPAVTSRRGAKNFVVVDHAASCPRKQYLRRMFPRLYG